VLKQGGEEMKGSTIDVNQEIWTYEDYRELPDDQKIYQVIGGKLFMVPAPSTRHQNISRNLEFIIWSFVKNHNLGEVYDAPIDVVLNSVNVVQPDIVFIAKNRLAIVKEKGIFGAPDWVIEIVSSSTSKIDIKLKKDLYERFGVREYWIVYPEDEKAEVYLLEGGNYKLKGAFLKHDTLQVRTIEGFRINLEEVFS